ncbi:MAG: peptidoglycan bridge formation glycyltransferase FemA/FemB family protein [Leptolinea sp.]|jgi:hypothetical protein|nr:peptidoglycan bridge formation glycyltransferase FemA/FemB family protein [Leptolinea sp.]
MSHTFSFQNVTIRNRQDLSQPEWDKFVDTTPQAWLWHQWDSQDAIDTWPGKHDLSFAIVDADNRGEILAIMPLHRLDRPFFGVIKNCILESTGGLACAVDLSKKQREIVQKAWLDYLFQIADRENAESIDISLTPMSPAYRGADCPRVNPLISSGFLNSSTQTYVIELSQSIDSIWDNMESYCRTHIRKAEKSGVTVREAKGEKDLETYYELHCATYHRTGVKPHPLAYFQMIWEKFVDQGKARVFFAELNGKVIAADNEATYKGAMSGWTAAGINDVIPGVNNLLHWKAIQWAIKNRYEFYESGEGFPGEKSGKRKGLTDFKRSFGGALYPYFRGRLLHKDFLFHLRDTIHALQK